MANITLLGASYTDVPAVTLPQTGGGTVTFYENGGGSVTVEDEPNATGITCVITTSSEPTPPTPSETFETIYEGTVSWYPDSDNNYPYCWISSLSSVSIPAGSVWRITYSNTEYRCTANSGGILGNPKWGKGTDDGSDVPFCFENAGWGAWTGSLNAPNTDSQYHFKIERKVT